MNIPGIFPQYSAFEEFILHSESGPNIETISVYVDDLGLFVNTVEGMNNMKKELNGKFVMTDLGEMKKILAIMSNETAAKGR